VDGPRSPFHGAGTAAGVIPRGVVRARVPPGRVAVVAIGIADTAIQIPHQGDMAGGGNVMPRRRTHVGGLHGVVYEVRDSRLRDLRYTSKRPTCCRRQPIVTPERPRLDFILEEGRPAATSSQVPKLMLQRQSAPDRHAPSSHERGGRQKAPRPCLNREARCRNR
jgi:hypothetical protein